MASNSSLAEHNLTREPELVEGREKVEALSKEGEELTKRVEEKMQELRKYISPTNTQHSNMIHSYQVRKQATCH